VREDGCVGEVEMGPVVDAEGASGEGEVAGFAFELLDAGRGLGRVGTCSKEPVAFWREVVEAMGVGAEGGKEHGKLLFLVVLTISNYEKRRFYSFFTTIPDTSYCLRPVRIAT
jgi:hypothetical protein